MPPATRARVAAAVLVAASVVAAFSGACGEHLDAPPAPDAGDETPTPPTDAPIEAGGTSSDAGATCVPEPIDPFDAGPEDDRCGPGGASVQLAIDPVHCGFCGNSCGSGGTCDQGRCQSKLVATTGHYVNVVCDGASSTNLYFGTNDSACTFSTVRRMPLDATAGDEAVLTMNNPGCVNWVAVRNDQELVYQRTTSGIHVTSLASPSHVEPGLVVNGNISGTHLAPSGIFWADSNVRISLASFDGGGPIVHQDLTAWVHAMAGDGDELWWTVGPQSDPGPADTALWSRKAGEPSSFKRIDKLGPIGALAFDAEYIYLAFTDGEVHRWRRDGTGSLELVTRNEALYHYPRAMVVAGESVFVAVGDPSNINNNPFELYRAKKCGGRARRISGGYMLGRSLAPVGKSLYYGDIGALRRIDVSAWLP